MTKLGIIGAMTIEIETLKEQMENMQLSCHAGMEFCEGMLEGLPVVVVQCGVGKVNAAMCTQILCSCYGVTHLVNTGIAGSLSNQLDIGDLVVSQDAMYHDFDCVHFGYEMGKVPGMDVVSFPADEILIRYAQSAAESVNPGHVTIGRVASGDQFVSAAAQKSRIVADTGAICTEMEGAAIAHAAWRNQVPFVVIRAISDKADDSAQMDYPTFEAIAAKRSAEVTRLLAKGLCK
jgi:adenosylhomocysteine nucleosidase